MADLQAEENSEGRAVTQSEVPAEPSYRCWYCKTPIIRGARCLECWRGWLVEEIPS